MSFSIVKLFGISSASLGEPQFEADYLQESGELGEELRLLLLDVNGFYAFESSLHVFPAESKKHYTDLRRWNNQDLWKSTYGRDLRCHLCFAEDVFGGQFCIYKEAIHYFEPETGELDKIALTLDDWAKLMTEDYNARTGFPLAHQWQTMNRALLVGERLIPKRPFVLGGDFATENLVAYNAVKGMQLRGELAKQIRDLPDGSRIQYEIT